MSSDVVVPDQQLRALRSLPDPAGMATRRLPVGLGQRAPWEREVAVAVDAPRQRRLFLDALAGGGA